MTLVAEPDTAPEKFKDDAEGEVVHWVTLEPFVKEIISKLLVDTFALKEVKLWPPPSTEIVMLNAVPTV